MPLRKTYKKKKVVRRRRAPVRRRAFRPARSVPDYASSSENHTITPPVGGNFTSGTMYEIRDIHLRGYRRSEAIASAYQHYRIKKVTLIVKPSYDTFQQAVGGPGKMRLYYMIDKSGSIPENVTLENLKQMGAKPINLDEKPIKISWRPSVLEAVHSQFGGANAMPAKYRISPWLSTDASPLDPVAPWLPSIVDHLGIFFYVDQVFLSGTQFQCELHVDFQFKKPLVQSPPAAVSATRVVAAVEDSSPDGIVGGNDTHLPPT